MNSSSMDFSIHPLEARFEMQLTENEFSPDSGEAHGYYGESWGDLGYGSGYTGAIQVASDNSGAMLDDGSFTDGSSGIFPLYSNNIVPQPCNPPCTPPTYEFSFCRRCRC